MQFTDIFIKRPVLASVVSLVILLLGLRAGGELTVREYPELRNAAINISVVYPGADPELIEGFITTPLEREIAAVDGIDFMTSSSRQSSSQITANLRPDKDPNEALTEISAKVNKLRSQLPEGSEDPVIAMADGGETIAMYTAFFSDTLSEEQITDYLMRVVEPQIASIAGIQSAPVLGARTYAMRVWLDPARLAAHKMTAGEVYNRIRQQNVLSAVGEAKGNYVRIGLSARTDLNHVDEFRDLVVKSDGDAVVRLRDVANVVLGAENYDFISGWDDDPAIFIGVEVRPDANVLEVISEIHDLWPGMVEAFPEGLEAAIGFDSTVYIRNAISQVQQTLIEAVAIVVLVIFLFLGSIRSSLIPAVTVPLSLVGALFLMFALGFSINLLTLLAMVLAIGMVVDDAIIVVENIHRHIEEGMKPMDAAISGARELVGPIIAMTLTLVAVYAPIGFLTGITGTLFTEFAFTLAGAVVISGIVALTLTPMMCARILKPSHGENNDDNRLAVWLDEKFEGWRQGYKERLHGALNTVHVIGVFGLIVLCSCYFLFTALPSELAPAEDIGFGFSIHEADGYASREYVQESFAESLRVARESEDIDHYFSFTAPFGGGTNQTVMGLIAKPWGEREKTTAEIIEELQPQFDSIAGLRISVILPPPLPTPGQGFPIEFVLRSTASPQTLAEVGNELVKRAMETNKFFFLAPELRIDRPEAVVDIDRNQAARLGVDMRQLSTDLSALLAGAEANRFTYEGRSYKVMTQAERTLRLNPDQLKDYYTRTTSGELVALSTLATLSERTKPRDIQHFQQLNSNTITGVPRPDVSQGEALAVLESLARDIMPADFKLDYAGSSRQFKQEGAALLITFAFALLMIYLVLAAQFESLRDPIIILVTVPMSISGALLVLLLLNMTNGMGLTNSPGISLNIYTQVGLVTLIGVISKHGILMVDFANKLQIQGMEKREAIEEAASIRLRPILMTTAALVLAMVPLLMTSGPGAAASFSLGLVIASGMTIGTLFTLYVVPAMYLYLGVDHRKTIAR